MPRHLRTEHRRLPHAHRITLLLATLIAPGLARFAEAAPPPPPPTFQGTFTSAGMCSPRGIALLPWGEVLVGSDCLDPHMARFNAAGGFLGTWGFPGGYQGSPNGVEADGFGNVFVTDYEGAVVHKFTSLGALVTSWGSFGTAPGRFRQPVDIAVNSSGDVFVLELLGDRVQKFTNTGSYLMTIGGPGSGPGQFLDATGIGVDASGRIYVADHSRALIIRFLASGAFDMEFATTFPPSDVAVGPDGNVYVIHFDVGGMRQYSSSGVYLQTVGSPLGMSGLHRISIGSTGAMYISEQYNHRVTKFQIDQTTSATRTTFGRLKAMYR